MEGSQVSQTRPEPVTFPVYTTGGRAHGRRARPAGRPSPRGTTGHVVTLSPAGSPPHRPRWPAGARRTPRRAARPAAHGPAPGVSPGGAPLSGSDPPQTHRDSLNALGNIKSSGICAENPSNGATKELGCREPPLALYLCSCAPKPSLHRAGGQEG